MLSSLLDWEQYIAPMMFAYSTNYQRTIKKSSFEVTFGIKPRASHNPNPDLRLQYGEDLGTEMFQRLKICQELEKNQVICRKSIPRILDALPTNIKIRKRQKNMQD